MSAKGFRNWAISVLSLVLAACGGGGGGSEDGGNSIVLSGFVEDGPLDKARVYLKDRNGDTLRVCGASGVGRCETLTDEKGEFFLRVKNEALSQPLELVTSGGFDTETGVDFAEIPLAAPLELFRGSEDRIVVTPLTSVLAARMRKEPDLSVARREVALELGLAEGDFVQRPSGDSALLHRALILTAIAMELSDAGVTADPFETVGTRDNEGIPILMNGGANPNRLRKWFDTKLVDAVEERLNALENGLRTGEGPLAFRFRKAALVQAIKKNLEMMAGNSLPSGEDELYESNVHLLADRILQAAAQNVIPLRGPVTQRIARYVLFVYNLVSVNSDDSINIDRLFEPNMAEQLEGISEDTRIPELAALKALYSTSVPLLKSEIPGNDNLKRLQYFYNSEASPFYLAEKFAGEMFDNRVSDLILMEVAEGKAEAGLLEEARLIVDTQIFQAEPKARAYDTVADRAINFGLSELASELLRLSEHYLKEAYESKKILSAAEVSLIMIISDDYQRLGDMAGWQRMIDYTKGFLPNPPVTPPPVTLYSAVLSETRKMAESYISSNLPEVALPLVQFMEETARDFLTSTIYAKTSRSFPIMFLKDTARLYADLDRPHDVLRLYSGDIEPNLGDSWAWMPEAVEVLYRAGYPEKALSLADQIPAPNDVAAKKLVATYLALQSGLDAALSFMDSHFKNTADRIEVLTYFAINPSRPYIALKFIQAGRIDEAQRALAIAASLLPTLSFSSDSDQYTYLVPRGYVKLANLYRQAGDEQSATYFLGEAEKVAGSLTGLLNKLDALMDIHVGYRELGSIEKANNVLYEAVRRAEEGRAMLPGTQGAQKVRRMIGELQYLQERKTLATIIPVFVEVVAGIPSPGSRVDDYLRASNYALLLPDTVAISVLGKTAREYAREMLENAVISADLITTPATKVAKFNSQTENNIIGGFAAAGYLEKAKYYIGQYLKTPNERNLGFQAIGKAFSARDDFPKAASAIIDTDGDLRPDFFHPLVAADPGLELDEDSDGDGIPDIEDRRPFFYDVPRKA